MVGHVCLFHDSCFVAHMAANQWVNKWSNYVRFCSLDLWTAALLVGVTVTEVTLPLAFFRVAICLVEHLFR